MYPQQQHHQLQQPQDLQQQQQQLQQQSPMDLDLVKPWKDPVVEDISDLIMSNPLWSQGQGPQGAQGQVGGQMDFASIQDFLGAIESNS